MLDLALAAARVARPILARAAAARATVDSCDLIRGIYGTWPDLWLDSCTVLLEMHLSDPEFVARLVVDCAVVPYASPDAGVDGWLYDDASRTLTLTGQPCDTFKAKGAAQLYVIPDLLTYPWRELSGFLGQEGMRPRERASVGDRGRSIRYAAADGWQSAI